MPIKQKKKEHRTNEFKKKKKNLNSKFQFDFKKIALFLNFLFNFD